MTTVRESVARFSEFYERRCSRPKDAVCGTYLAAFFGLNEATGEDPDRKLDLERFFVFWPRKEAL